MSKVKKNWRGDIHNSATVKQKLFYVYVSSQLLCTPLSITSEAPGASGPGGGDHVLSTLLLAQGHTGVSDSLASDWQPYLGPVTSLPLTHR